MAFPCWHFCQRCKKNWCHSIPDPCAELDQFFERCQSCALIAEPLPEPRRAIAIEDVEDMIEELVSTDGDFPTVIPADVNEIWFQ